jgi:hypothetical protein
MNQYEVDGIRPVNPRGIGGSRSWERFSPRPTRLRILTGFLRTCNCFGWSSGLHALPLLKRNGVVSFGERPDSRSHYARLSSAMSTSFVSRRRCTA